jgi:hypothetical protein
MKSARFHPSFRGSPSENPNARLRIVEPRDSGFASSKRPGMTEAL